MRKKELVKIKVPKRKCVDLSLVVTNLPKKASIDFREVFHIPGTKSFRDLLASIIDRAVLDLTHGDRLEIITAKKWLHSKSYEKWSFNWCLIHLDIPVEYGLKLIKMGLSGEYNNYGKD